MAHPESTSRVRQWDVSLSWTIVPSPSVWLTWLLLWMMPREARGISCSAVGPLWKEELLMENLPFRPESRHSLGDWGGTPPSPRPPHPTAIWK